MYVYIYIHVYKKINLADYGSTLLQILVAGAVLEETPVTQCNPSYSAVSDFSNYSLFLATLATYFNGLR